MSDLQREKILSFVSAENFIGRTRELDALLRCAGNEERGLLLLSAPALGASELLRQTYDQLFYDQGKTIPFYFALRKSDKNARNAALRFLQNFLLQTVAFRRQDKKILDASPEICELSELAVPSDSYWIDRLIAACQSESRLNDDRAFIRNCLSAPLRAAARGARSFVIIDDLHEAAYFSGEYDFIEELKEIFSRAGFPFVFAGRRRFVWEAMQTGGIKLENFEILELEPLALTEAGLLAENLSEKYEVKINDQTRDLIGQQLQGSPAFIRFLFQSAGETGTHLDSFHRVEQVYADEIFGGRIGKFYRRIFSEIIRQTETQKNILSLLYDALTIEKEKTPVESWQKLSGLDDEKFHCAIRLLNTHEFISLSSDHVEVMKENEVLSDYLHTRFRLEIFSENRALVIGEMLSNFLKRAPHLMARFYRRGTAIGLRELLSAFNLQETPLALLDYSRFKDELKGAPNEEVLKYLERDSEKIRLPQIAFTAHTVAFYPPIEQVIEKERSAVAIGFESADYKDENETVWIAAEIDSKLEASKELAEFWCDRLEVVALMCDFLNYKLWLVAPEGFSPEALEVLSQRNAFGSSRKQVELLIKHLGAENVIGEKIKPNEFEMVVPMGEDTELIAAHTVEEIARRHHFPSKSVNQIKTAVVEACINAAEHSHSPDRKIYQKFIIEKDKIIITISNRGLRLTDKKAQEFTPEEGKRGWGLRLIQNLMDEVKFEQVDDGTRISMVKYLEKTEKS